MMTPIEIAAFDLRRTCVHEAAHCAVARHFGYYAYWRAWQTDASDWCEDCFYTGRTYFNETIEASELRLIGLAGSLAEYLYEEPELDPGDVYVCLCVLNQLSDSDAQSAEGFDQDDVCRCIEILRQHWSEIMDDAFSQERNLSAERDGLIERGTDQRRRNT